MIITKKQLGNISQTIIEQFVLNCISFLKINFPDWCREKNNEELRKFIYSTIDFGKKNNIKREQNIIKLMKYVFEFNIDLILLQKVYQDSENGEDYRMEELHLTLLSARYKLIPVTI